MLQLNLEVFDENGVRLDALSQDNVSIQHLQAVLVFLRAGWSFKVNVTNASGPSSN